jgi:hypothetical protein
MAIVESVGALLGAAPPHEAVEAAFASAFARSGSISPS